MVYRKHIHYLDNDSLLQVFSCYRLEEEDNWYLQLTWRKLVQVCRRWRYLVFNSCSHLDLCLRLTNDSPSMHTPSHLPLLPLVIYHSDRTRTVPRKDEDNIHLGLLQHGRVRQVILQAPSLSLSMWVEPMNNVFPRLEVLSLLSTTIGETNLMLPETLQAPDLRRLVLHGIGLPRRLTLLSSSITLSTITLTHIGASCYFSPKQLVTQLQSLPHLVELSIGFAIPIPLPSSEGKLLPSPIPPVTLPTLRRFKFRGVDIYLDNLVAQINTPFLEQLDLTLFFDLTFTLVNLTEFIHRTKGFGSLVARLIFNKDGASINTGYERGNRKLGLHVNCEPLDWQIDSATQVCSTLGKVLSIVEELTVDLDKDVMPPGWENTLESTMWHELLLPFIGVKKLRIGPSLTLELSQALESVAGGLVLELLPKLQELEVQLEIDRVKKALSLFLETRESVGRPVHRVVLHQPFFQYSQCTRRKIALCIGINYIGRSAALGGCINDARDVERFICDKFGYNRNDIVVLTDDQQDPRSIPTRDNMLRAMQWLVMDVRPNDSLFFHYSGHGGQTKDLDSDEEDGFDEVIYPVDFRKAGHITGDTMHDIMVKPLPPGCRLTAIFDSCHSGSALDLPYVYSTEGKLKEPNLLRETGRDLFTAASSYARGDIGGAFQSVTGFVRSATTGRPAQQKTLQTKTSPADVISWSACKDSQISADAGTATGGISYGLRTALTQQPRQSYQQLLISLRHILHANYGQNPLLSSSHPMDTRLEFIA